MSRSWSSRHFSLTNPRDDEVDDQPKLLRRLADEIEASQLDPMEILDLTISQEIIEGGPWWVGLAVLVGGQTPRRTEVDSSTESDPGRGIPVTPDLSVATCVP
jgi:hypothetical protein